MAKIAAPAKHVFLSKRTGLRLVRIPSRRRVADDGSQFFTDGLRYEFDSGTLSVSEGQDVRSDGPEGTEQDVVTWLRNHPGYQSDQGFHEIGQEPDRVPDPSPVLERVARLAGARDEAGLAEILAEESAGHQRPEVLAALKGAVAGLSAD